VTIDTACNQMLFFKAITMLIRWHNTLFCQWYVYEIRFLKQRQHLIVKS